MRIFGNILWFLLAGLWLFLGWALAGLLWCVTLIGIPWGVQCFKFAKLASFPFGKDVLFGSGVGSLLLNILWVLLSGVPLAIEAMEQGKAVGMEVGGASSIEECWSLVIGAVLCATVVGIPFGLQCFKIAKLAFLPFGARIVPSTR